MLDGYTFCVGDRGFPFSDASHLLNSRAAWVPSPALPFIVGNTVGLSVVPLRLGLLRRGRAAAQHAGHAQ